MLSLSDSNDSDSGSAQRFNLRPRAMKRRLSQTCPREKVRPAPLSKYRRKTANARERFRMQEINDAFEKLRNVMPEFPTEADAKLTKITTLKLAMNYIDSLSKILTESEKIERQRDGTADQRQLNLDELYGDIQELIESDATDLSLSDASI